MWAIACGNPFDGIQLVGPFFDPEVAHEFADRKIDVDWWLVRLQEPKSFNPRGLAEGLDSFVQDLVDQIPT